MQRLKAGPLIHVSKLDLFSLAVLMNEGSKTSAYLCANDSILTAMPFTVGGGGSWSWSHGATTVALDPINEVHSPPLTQERVVQHEVQHGH